MGSISSKKYQLSRKRNFLEITKMKTYEVNSSSADGISASSSTVHCKIVMKKMKVFSNILLQQRKKNKKNIRISTMENGQHILLFDKDYDINNDDDSLCTNETESSSQKSSLSLSSPSSRFPRTIVTWQTKKTTKRRNEDSLLVLKS